MVFIVSGIKIDTQILFCARLGAVCRVYIFQFVNYLHKTIVSIFGFAKLLPFPHSPHVGYGHVSVLDVIRQRYKNAGKHDF